MLETTSAMVLANELKKGDVLAAARFAGVQAAKGATLMMSKAQTTTPEEVTLDFKVFGSHIDVESLVLSNDGSRAEIQAMTAAAVAALTIYDMCKSVDHTMVIEEVDLVEQSTP